MHGPLRLISWACAIACLSGCNDTIDYDCSVFPPAESSQYVLPWHVGHAYVASPHAARETSPQKYAIDVPMPIGTDVLAIRAGTVVRVEEQFFDGDNVPGHENYVFVQHDDGSVARYVHLTNSGAAVAVNDSVQPGQLIGYSGHTGNSTDPHLHLDVSRGCCVVPPNWNELPIGETIPLSFRNAKPVNVGNRRALKTECGLQRGVSYEAVAL
jgi:murein DD-endopeptidase MepM/ murein hydrolase activator NlpD